MRYASTRDPEHRVALSAAIEAGIAPDGGLYVPETFPRFGGDDFEDAAAPADIGVRVLAPFFEGDALAGSLDAIIAEALDFPLPLKRLRPDAAVLELFHGPTAAFKDVGARFLAACMARLPLAPGSVRTILVATSGDTGGAVGAAFEGRPGTEVVILYPLGRVSARQEQQLTCWGGNVTALAVRGDFDDCQRLAKAAFADPALRAGRRLSSANSINIGRLLPQLIYHAAAALEYRRATGRAAGFIIPTGNAGNAVACLWAQRLGLPIREVVLATNANRAIPDYLDGGEWQPVPAVATLASAMDVGAPSNMERAFALAGGERLRHEVRAFAVSDDAIRERIRRGPSEWGEVWDPHTATAVDVLERIGASDWIVVATAHPAKFETIVEPLIGRRVPVPPALAAVLRRPTRRTIIEPTLPALLTQLGSA
jgi:threonine synthase